jgi:hypothetical protein
MATSAFLLAPRDTLPDRKKAEERMAAVRWDCRLLRVLSYRSGYKELKACKRGGVLGYLQNRGEVDAFYFGMFEDELSRLLSLARHYPGDYLAIWTYGQAVHIHFIRSGEALEQKEASFRLTAPSGMNRPLGLFEDFCAWFNGSAFSPDIGALKKNYAGPEISVAEWFKAFGINGAVELKRADGKALWKDFEDAAQGLLKRGEVPASAVKRLNAVLGSEEGRASLKTRPLARSGLTSRLIAEIEYDLREAIGPSEDPLWEARARAAGFYWDITEGEALDALTTGSGGKKGYGESASFGRLLCHYPESMRRDNIFLALAGLQAEGANGHAYVPAFFSFAEISHQAGFTLAIFPSDLRQSFRMAFGIEGGTEIPAIDPCWSAELFLPLPGILTVPNVREGLEKWFKKEKAEGIILCAGADGAWETTAFTDKIAVKDQEKMRSSAIGLDMAGLFESLGLPDLLKPGEWQQGAYGGEGREADKGDERAAAMEKFSRLPEPRLVPGFKTLLDEFPSDIRHKKNKSGSGSSIPVVLRLSVPEAEDAWLRGLMGDFRLKGMVESYGSVWMSGGIIWALTRCQFVTSMLLRLIGSGLPVNTSLSIERGEKAPRHYVLKEDIPGNEHQFRSCLIESGEPEEMKKAARSLSSLYQGIPDDSELLVDVVYEGGARIYFKADLSGWSIDDESKISALGQSLESAGLKPLGDLVCSAFSNIVIRGFAGNDVYAVLMMPVFGEWVLEFVTSFEDDTSLTTTTNVNAGRIAETGASYIKVDSKSYSKNLSALPSEMLRQHDERVKEMRGAAARRTEPELAGLAVQIEKSLRKHSAWSF